MWRCFSDFPELHPFTAQAANVDLSSRNIASAPMMDREKGFDLTHADGVPDREFNRYLWQAIKGKSVAVPPLTRSAFVRTTPLNTDDE